MAWRKGRPGPVAPALARALVAGNVAVVLILAVTTGLALRDSREAHAAQARQAVENLALTLGVVIASDIKQVDNALLSTLAQVDPAGGEVASLPEMARIADQQRALVPKVDAMRVTDEQGRVLNANGAAVSVADRDYFAAARDKPGRLAMSDPLQGRIIKKWGVIFARARQGPQGEFRGLVYSNLSTSHFVHTFDGVALGPRGAAAVRTTSLKLVARYSAGQPAADAEIGTDQVSPELRSMLAQSPEHGFYVSRSAFDGIERANAYRQVPGYPLMVLVGLATEDFYRDWWTQAVTVTGLCVLLAFVVAGLSVVVYRAQEREIASRRDMQRLAAEQHALLDNELVGMVKLRNRVEVWHNRALEILFGYPTEELAGQPSRLLYLDDESHERVGQAYRTLEEGQRFRTQLQMRRKDGSPVWIDLSGVRLPSGESLWLMVDIGAMKESEFRARDMALSDPLTGLANRLGLQARFGPMLRQADRKGSQVAVCFIDLDGFKAVNDRHGHEAGDALLCHAAQRIVSCTRSNDLVARQGGDEFVVVLGELAAASEAELALMRILQILAQPFDVAGAQIRIAASIGIALYPRDGMDPDALLAKADAAMYEAKRSGKGRLAFHGAAQTVGG